MPSATVRDGRFRHTHATQETRMKFTHQLTALGLGATLALSCSTAFAQKGETVKIAWIDPLSGLMAPVGQNQVKTFQFLAEHFNKSNPAGVKFEIIATNSKCSYWHFRFDADTSMKMEAMTTFMKDQPEVKKVYLINQNYSHGQQVSKYAKEILARKRPDVQIVGDDLHPLAQVKDFAPYVAQIKASGAATVITGNWGSDLTLLIKAAKEAGLNASFYTYYAGVSGT